jgi:hypothetical protein
VGDGGGLGAAAGAELAEDVRHVHACPPGRRLDRTGPPACPGQEKLARLRLIELLTGTHPYYLPPPLTLPARHGQKYAEFVFCLGQRQRSRLLQVIPVLG